MKVKINWKEKLDFILFGWIINLAYPQYYRPKYKYLTYRQLFFFYFIPQKILRINGYVPWPVHFTSQIHHYPNIQKGVLCDPGDSPGVYIHALSGIIIGNNVDISPGVKIITADHTTGKHHLHDEAPPMKIGNNVFIYANSVVLPGVEIGDNVIIGAGSVVTKSIPSNSVAVGNPCKVIKTIEPYVGRIDEIQFNRKLPENIHIS